MHEIKVRHNKKKGPPHYAPTFINLESEFVHSYGGLDAKVPDPVLIVSCIQLIPWARACAITHVHTTEAFCYVIFSCHTHWLYNYKRAVSHATFSLD